MSMDKSGTKEFLKEWTEPLHKVYNTEVFTEDMEESCNEIDLTEVFEEALDVTNDTEDEEFNKELEELMQYSSDITLPDEVVLEVSDIN